MDHGTTRGARAGVVIEHGGGEDKGAFSKLAAQLRYVDGDYNDPTTFTKLRAELDHQSRAIHYLAIPPSMFPLRHRPAGRGELHLECPRRRRKPFGRDLASVRELNRALHEVFDEECVFRINHYLGKEAVQNILYFRFANVRFSSGSGIGTTSRTCRSPWPRASG